MSDTPVADVSFEPEVVTPVIGHPRGRFSLFPLLASQQCTEYLRLPTANHNSSSANVTSLKYTCLITMNLYKD